MIYVLALNLFIATFSFADIVRIKASDAAATQTEVGREAVKKMMVYWTEQAHSNAQEFELELKKRASTPLPGCEGPSLWTDGKTETYIADGHHRASAINQILNGSYEDLPEPVRKVMSREAQIRFRSSPEFQLSVDVQNRYSNLNDMLQGFLKENIGQLKRATRMDPKFIDAARAVRNGNASTRQLKILARSYSQMARRLINLENSSLRSAIGNTFFESGIDSVYFKNYIEFETAEKLGPRLLKHGVKVTDENAFAPETVNAIRRELLAPEDLEFLKNSQRLGKEAEAQAVMKTFTQKFYPALCAEPFSLIAH